MPQEIATTAATATASGDANTGFWKELDSWKTPIAKQVGPQVEVGAKAPWSQRLRLPDGKPTLVVFLRHCGYKVPSVHCIAVSHSSEEATDRWLPQVGGTWNIDMVIDEERDLYANWGLGISSTWHAVNPFTMWNVFSLGKNEGIWNRPTESGSRWQTSGAFAVDRDGTVRWAQVARTADDLPDLKGAMTALGFPPPVDKRRPKHDH
ncbi:thioredoxin-like fold protein [Fusarium flagelliforme]|uniref:Thioredoxin-like fold protein n=1 Tax=Fusarium flagelliforme TaxID=2675880 RepID=A0A395MH17_9HYPO|nr:thioredoxin-like fold protein [Fusarium flagelliforme]